MSEAHEIAECNAVGLPEQVHVQKCARELVISVEHICHDDFRKNTDFYRPLVCVPSGRPVRSVPITVLKGSVYGSRMWSDRRPSEKTM